MAQGNCCAPGNTFQVNHKKQLDSYRRRGWVALISGFLMFIMHHVPALHIYYQMFWGKVFCLVYCSVFLYLSLQEDFSQYKQEASDIICSLMLIIIAMGSHLLWLKWLLNLVAVAIVVKAFMLPQVVMKGRYFLISLSAIVVASFFSSVSFLLSLSVTVAAGLFILYKHRDKIARSISIEKSATVTSVMAWALSSMNIFWPGSYQFSILFHDVLLAMGAVSLGRYYQAKDASSLIGSGDTLPKVLTKIDNQLVEVSPVDLPIGTKIQLRKAGDRLPFKVKSSCCIWYEKEGQEVAINQLNAGARTGGKGTIVPSYCRIGKHNGHLIVQEKFSPVQARQEESKKTWFLLGVVWISLLAGSIYGLWVGSVLSGLRQFVLSLMSACSCIYVIARPIIYSRAGTWAKERIEVRNASIWEKKVDCVIFDRTGTLMVDSGQGDYKPVDGAGALIRSLQKMGIKVMVISGHRPKCDEDFKRRFAHLVALGIKGENILMDNRFNGERGKLEKRREVAHVQRYNCFTHQGSVSSRRVHTMMVGDGTNDEGAAKQADVAVAVSGNAKLEQFADVRVDNQSLGMLSKLIETMRQTQPSIAKLTYLAWGYNLMMMGLANGGYWYATGMMMPSSLACGGMMLFSFLLLGLSRRFKLAQCHTKKSMTNMKKTHLASQMLQLEGVTSPVKPRVSKKVEKSCTEVLTMAAQSL